jgi:Lrp/AsnC family transcriptional regulator, leucine-responsive regulatory protein
LKIEFDAMDVKILEILQADARTALAEVGRRVHMSQPAVAERVRRMEAAGAISGYHARIDPAVLGYGIIAFIRVSRRGHETPVEAVAERVPQIVECHSITGDDCSIVKVLAASVKELEQVIAELARCGVTSTSLVLSSFIERKAVKPVQ